MNSETAPVPPSDGPAVVFKKRSAKVNARKRPATPPPESSSSEEDYSSEDEGVRQVKRRRKTAVVTASSATQKPINQDFSTTKFTADRSTTIVESNDATRQSNWYEEKADDLSAQNLLGKTRKQPSTTLSTPDDPRAALDGKYKGQAAYTSFISKNPDAPPKLVGPMKAGPTNIRTITITDFAPDVCKDYKQTGFCGFGDNCKFLHAREDYKQGWALDRDWEIKTKGKAQKGTIVASANKSLLETDEEEADAALLEKIPFACIICKKPYTEPVITKCGHYFCEACALQRYRKKPDCAACGAGTNGVFNGAKGLTKLLERKKMREDRLREKAEADAVEE